MARVSTALDEVRRRLEALNRAPLPPSVVAGSELPAVVPFDPAERTLERQLPGEVITCDAGRAYLIRRIVGEVEPDLRNIAAGVSRAVESRHAGEGVLDGDEAVAASDLLFFDIETCGFSGTPLFLIGLLFVDGGVLRVEQLLARTYAEEAAILSGFRDRHAVRRHLVTFNGKAFDWPFVRDRAAAARIKLASDRPHTDLLHAARRVYRDTLPDCRLQTLERHFCGRTRVGDIAGFDIPAAYHNFVESGDARRLKAIAYHNYLDLVTMAELLAVLRTADTHRTAV